MIALVYRFGCFNCEWRGGAEGDVLANRAVERHTRETGHGTWMSGWPA